MGFRLVDREVVIYQKKAPIESRIPSAMANTVGTTNSRAILLWVIADTRFDLPQARKPLSLSRGIENEALKLPKVHLPSAVALFERYFPSPMSKAPRRYSPSSSRRSHYTLIPVQALPRRQRIS
jgi:hypothetical protein